MRRSPRYGSPGRPRPRRGWVCLLAIAACSSTVAAACGAPGLRGPVTVPPPAGPRARLAVLPIHNLSGAPAPVALLDDAAGRALRARGLHVIDREDLERFLARHRLRHTGGIDEATARAARDELGADAVVVTTLYQYARTRPPRLAVGMRLISAGDGAHLMWADTAARAGDEAPGLLDLGVIGSAGELHGPVLGRLSASLASYLRARRPSAIGCRRERRFAPRTAFRAPALTSPSRRSVAVLPFVNHTARARAGEVIADAAIRQLQAAHGLEVIEPGVVRRTMLATRFVLAGGIDLSQARLLLDVLDAETILIGDVFEFDEDARTPTIGFSLLLLDRKTDRVLWRSSSYNHGDDGVFFFELGRVGTAAELACRMLAATVDAMQLAQPPTDVAAAAAASLPVTRRK